MDPSIIERVINITEKIQQIPAPTFEEKQRADFIARKFIDVGVNDVTTDQKGNVYAHIKGLGEKSPLIISAHLDTVFPRDVDLSLSRTEEKIFGAGIGDNSLGLAGLFGLYWSLCEATREQNSTPVLPGDLWLVANVSEEGLGNLQGMNAVVNRFKDKVLGYIVLEGMSLGQLFHRGLGVKRYGINAYTRGGHSWVDYGRPSAIHELAELVVKIKNLDYPKEPQTSFNIGVFSGGTSINTIAEEASLQLDLRSTSSRVLEEVSGQVEALVEIANHKMGADLRLVAEVIGKRPAGEIAEDHPLVKLAIECHANHGLEPKLNIGSTDANEPLSRGYPAICVGLSTGGGSHTSREYINLKPIRQGLEILVDYVQAVFRI